jgi:Zn-finger nucleic acid-binding protein
MITLELADVEIDYCTDCGGIWLDAGELELLLGNPEQAEKLLNSFKIDTASPEKYAAKKCKKSPSACPHRPCCSTNAAEATAYGLTKENYRIY